MLNYEVSQIGVCCQFLSFTSYLIFASYICSLATPGFHSQFSAQAGTSEQLPFLSDLKNQTHLTSSSNIAFSLTYHLLTNPLLTEPLG